MPENSGGGAAPVGATAEPRVRRWTRRIVVVAIVLGLVQTGSFAFNMYENWPLPSGHEKPRPSEARAALGAMKDRARVVYMRTGNVPQTMAELDMPSGALDGGEFTVGDYVVHGGKAGAWSATCMGVYTKDPKDLKITANLIAGSASFNR